MTNAHNYTDEEEKSNWGGIVLIMLPVILVTMASSLVGFAAARQGAARGAVRFWLFPANFIISNVIGLLVFVPLNFVYTLLTGKSQMLYPRVTDFLDLTLFNVWGRLINWFWDWGATAADFIVRVPTWHIMVFQVVVWLFIGNAFANFWTSCIMKMAGREE